MQLSICMMVKNEEKRLDECLAALKPILEYLKSELIIVDTGSEDRTVEIAQKHTNKVYFHKWNNHFSEMRNITLSYAKGDWVFIIDGDEILEDTQSIIDFFRLGEYKNYNTATLEVKNFTEENNDRYIPITGSRLFKKTKDLSYTGAVHNQISYKGPIKNLEAKIAHYGYVQDPELMEIKFKRTATLLEEELEKDPNNIYYWFQLASSYELYKKLDKALEYIMKGYSLVKAQNLSKKEDLKSYIYIYISAMKINLANKKYDIAEKLGKEIYEVAKEYIDINCYLGYALYYQEKHEDAVEYLQRYLELEAKFDQLDSAKDPSIQHYTRSSMNIVYMVLGNIYYNTKQYHRAIQYALLSEEGTGLGSGHVIILKSCLDSKDYKGLYDYYVNLQYGEDSTQTNKFRLSLEQSLFDMKDEEEKQAIHKIFSKDDGQYALLHETRYLLSTNQTDDKVLEKIYEIDFRKLPNYYGSILLYFLKNKIDLMPWIRDSYEQQLNNMINYLKQEQNEKESELIEINDLIDNASKDMESQSNELVNIIVEYVKSFNLNSDEKDIDVMRLYKSLIRYILVFDGLEEEAYMEFFHQYIKYGTQYIQSIYHPSVLEEEKIYHMKNGEESFFVYMNKAIKAKEEDKTVYVKNLRKALEEFELTRGIEFLLQEFEDEENASNPEMETLKNQFKTNIRQMIESKMLVQAEQMIQQYEELMESDVEILLFKSQISLMLMNGEDNNILN